MPHEFRFNKGKKKKKKAAFMKIHAKSLCRKKHSPDLRNLLQYTQLSKSVVLEKDCQTFSESNLTNFMPKNSTKPLWVFQI